LEKMLRLILAMLFALSLAACSKAESAAKAAIAPWEPVDGTFTGCEGG
jgi:hypothetical protein